LCLSPDKRRVSRTSTGSGIEIGRSELGRELSIRLEETVPRSHASERDRHLLDNARLSGTSPIARRWNVPGSGVSTEAAKSPDVEKFSPWLVLDTFSQ
jgi:hypothetical protein